MSPKAASAGCGCSNPNGGCRRGGRWPSAPSAAQPLDHRLLEPAHPPAQSVQRRTVCATMRPASSSTTASRWCSAISSPWVASSTAHAPERASAARCCLSASALTTSSPLSDRAPPTPRAAIDAATCCHRARGGSSAKPATALAPTGCACSSMPRRGWPRRWRGGDCTGAARQCRSMATPARRRSTYASTKTRSATALPGRSSSDTGSRRAAPTSTSTPIVQAPAHTSASATALAGSARSRIKAARCRMRRSSAIGSAQRASATEAASGMG